MKKYYIITILLIMLACALVVGAIGLFLLLFGVTMELKHYVIGWIVILLLNISLLTIDRKR